MQNMQIGLAVLAVLIIVFALYSYYNKKSTLVSQPAIAVADSTGALLHQPIPVIAQPAKHDHDSVHPEDVMQAAQMKNLHEQSINPRTDEGMMVDNWAQSGATRGPNQDYNAYMLDQVLDQRTIDNQMKWNDEVKPWSQVSFTVDIDLDLEATLNFLGLRRPQPIPISENRFYVTEIDSAQLAVNPKFNFNGTNVLEEALAKTEATQLAQSKSAVQSAQIRAAAGLAGAVLAQEKQQLMNAKTSYGRQDAISAAETSGNSSMW